MNPVFSFYSDDDFGRVLRFIKAASAQASYPYEAVRFQFSRALHPHMGGAGFAGYFSQTCGIWEDAGGIAALSMTEGDSRRGEAFFLFRSLDERTPELARRVFTFAERFASKVSADRKSNALTVMIPEEDALLARIAAGRGYEMTDGVERVMIKEYGDGPLEVALPEGFVIRDARAVPPSATALAHAHAFRYDQPDDGVARGFAAIRAMPDYRPELDLVLFDGEGQPCGLANHWVDEASRTATLEPLGVAWWYRGMGLGRALIHEGVNRTRALGCARMIGGDQPFYEALGFAPQPGRDAHAWRLSKAQ